jgi:hypothetical protein
LGLITILVTVEKLILQKYLPISALKEWFVLPDKINGISFGKALVIEIFFG